MVIRFVKPSFVLSALRSVEVSYQVDSCNLRNDLASQHHIEEVARLSKVTLKFGDPFVEPSFVLRVTAYVFSRLRIMWTAATSGTSNASQHHIQEGKLLSKVTLRFVVPFV